MIEVMDKIADAMILVVLAWTFWKLTPDFPGLDVSMKWMETLDETYSRSGPVT